MGGFWGSSIDFATLRWRKDPKMSSPSSPLTTRIKADRWTCQRCAPFCANSAYSLEAFGSRRALLSCWMKSSGRLRYAGFGGAYDHGAEDIRKASAAPAFGRELA